MVMRRLSLSTCLLLAATPALPQDDPVGRVFDENLMMCPDPQGEEQKELFDILDLSESPMRIEGMGEFGIRGFSADLLASRSSELGFEEGESVDEKINEAFERLSEWSASNFTGEPQQLAVACFATEPSPSPDVDGPFHFMPGFVVEDAATADPVADTVIIPPQTYLVLTWTGPESEIGNMRFTMTEQFWPAVAPRLGLERANGPNIMIYSEDSEPGAEEMTLDFYMPIEPVRVGAMP